MRTRMNQLLTLLERDVRNAPWRRLALGVLLIAVFQALTALGSGAHSKHRIEWPALFFFLWLFGFLAAIGLSFDRVSSERESRALDLLLTSGATRAHLIASKVVVVLLLSAALAVGFLATTTVVYAPMVGAPVALSAWRHLVPICAVLTVYALLGLACSTAFRTSKAALLVAFSLTLALRPRLHEALVQAVARALGLEPRVAAALQALNPEIALVHVTGVGPMVVERQPGIAWLGLIGLAVLAIALAVAIFMRQEEPTYGD
jgi:ABC-type Na+ efflux pump permease subunit